MFSQQQQRQQQQLMQQIHSYMQQPRMENEGERHNSNNHKHNNNNNWWKQSVAQRAISFVESDLQHVLSQSPFLRHSQAGEHIAVFHRSEIITGNRLGKGGFSDVHAVIGFNLNPYYSQQLDAKQQQLRLNYQHSVASGQGRYAVKFLQDQLLENAKNFQCAASDLAVEAAYMSSLNHPNILPVRGLPIDGLHAFGDGRHDGYFIILDQLEETLDDRIKRWKTTSRDAPFEEKAECALQLASALEYLHERRIVYRDLKPHNVGFNMHGQLQLLDFGLCREVPDGTLDGVYEMSGVGTRRYMATEIINTSRYNAKADVYAWSMVFWEMLYLDRPFPHYSIEEHKTMVCEAGERPPLPYNWPMPIRKILQQSWTASIQHRYSMREAGLALQNYLNSLKVIEIPESPVAVYDRTLLQMDDSFMNGDGFPCTPMIHLSLPTAEDLVHDHQMSVVSCNVNYQYQQPHPMPDVYTTDMFDTSLLGMTSEGVEVIPDHHYYNASPAARNYIASAYSI